MTSIKSSPAAAHVTRLLQGAAGQDGVVSRADAKKLVEQLRAEGKGTEAMAVDAVFTAIDKADAGPGARVTGYDLSAHQDLISALQNRTDLGLGQVLSPEELARVEAGGAALQELAQVLALEPKRGRLPHRIPRLGLEHVAAMLASVGTDGVVSREDVARLVDSLKSRGRGTEALAAEVWFRFIDHRDHQPGARVTADDLEKALLYSDEHLLKAKDKNRDGYSAREIEKFSISAKAFLLLGKMIDAGQLDSAATRGVNG